MPPATTDVDHLTEDAVLYAGHGRELVVATGADRVRFLHGLLTGDVAGQPPGRGCHAALLTPKGHVVGDLRVFVREEDIWIVVDAGQGEPIAAALNRYAIMDDFAAVPHPSFAIVSVLGPAAGERLAALGLDGRALEGEPLLSHARVVAPVGPGGLWLAWVHELGAPGFWLGGAPAEVAAVQARLEAAGMFELDPVAAEAARIAALEPKLGVEITPDYFPMEVGLADAIDYGKGCYLGQEPIVRIRDRGHINWRLAALDLLGPGEPGAGDLLESDAKPKAGRITSAARLPDGRGVALGMVHVSVPVGATIRVRVGSSGGGPGGASMEARVRAEVASR